MSRTETIRKFCSNHKIKSKLNRPSLSDVNYIIKNFKESGCVNTLHSGTRGQSNAIKEQLKNGFQKMKNTGEHLTSNSMAKHAQSPKLPAWSRFQA